ncbi:IclR family transcriptional regulator [Streptomyces yaanensis]|uniref:IclR family transcriptional regulator n=1 Tax=Streptomyces yaanensis TaxID=1142239 RepID=A0ABV7SNI7_9ACTN|nr:IclR family transcriptional regulator [Streptomyces sp. CGMCC 4.7035]WNC00389.1 IclR family transcriptional regulator [Streptomyces sp. CGMCC 4.7035]
MAGENDALDESAQVEPSSGLIGAVVNVLHVLRMFEDHEVIRVNQVARDLGMSRSTVHRMLATLGHHQFVERDPESRGYRPGPALVDIGLSVVVNIDIRAISREALVRLRDETGETAHLATLRGADVVYLDSVEGTRAVRTRSGVGWILPAHATAIGKVLLAELPEADLAALYPTGDLEALTPRTFDTLEVLRPELAAIRQRGYATSDGESEADVYGVGAVVRDRHGRARAAIAVSAPRSRVDEAWVEMATASVMRISGELRERIG